MCVSILFNFESCIFYTQWSGEGVEDNLNYATCAARGTCTLHTSKCLEGNSLSTQGCCCLRILLENLQLFCLYLDFHLRIFKCRCHDIEMSLSHICINVMHVSWRFLQFLFYFSSHCAASVYVEGGSGRSLAAL